MNKTKPICLLFAISFFTFCTVYCRNRSVNIRFARSGQECPEPINIGGM